MRLRALAWLALLPWAATAHAGALVRVDDANGWCSTIDDGDCHEFFLADDPSLRIVHYGFDDGMRFDLFLRRGRRYSHQLTFVPMRQVGDGPGRYERIETGVGFSAPVVDKTGDGVSLRYSFEYTFEDDMGEMLADRWQKRVPAVLFETTDNGKASDIEPGPSALPMQFETLSIRQAIGRSKHERTGCAPPTRYNELVSSCP